MNIEHRRIGKCDVLTVSGDITAADVSELESALQTLLSVGRFQIVVDMAACTYIGSAGLSTLISFANSCRRWQRGDLYLAALPDYIADLLQIAGLNTEYRTFFQVFETTGEAVDAVCSAGSDE